MERPPLQLSPGERGPDDIEGLLRAFFRSELPASWPELALPPAPPRSEPPWRFHVSSRFLLAASVAFLFACSLSLSGAFRDTEQSSARNPVAKPLFPTPERVNNRGQVKGQAGNGQRAPAGRQPQ